MWIRTELEQNNEITTNLIDTNKRKIQLCKWLLEVIGFAQLKVDENRNCFGVYASGY